MAHGVPLGIRGVTFGVATVQDITAERRLEEELDQSRRLEAVGQLTAGIAHDFNNLLQAIIGYLDLMNDDADVSSTMREYVRSALRLAEQGGELTHNLLSFAGRQLLLPEEVDLGDFLNKFHRLLSHTLDPRIRIAVLTEPTLASVWVDARHLQNALLNVAINARDAMPSGGNLRIEAFGSRAAAATGMEHVRGDHLAVIRISDTGTGIAPDDLAKVCEPFFSTKGISGTGLGLSMVHGFVKQSGGDMRIASELGNGTCVEIWLPVAP